MKTILFFLLSLIISQSVAGREVGLVTTMSGTIRLTHNGVEKFLKPDSIICSDDTIRTESDAWARILFYDPDLAGTEIVGSSRIFEISDQLNTSTAETAFKELPKELLYPFIGLSAKTPVSVKPFAEEPAKFIIFPRGRTDQEIQVIIWYPVKNATEYLLKITAETDKIVTIRELHTRKNYLGCIGVFKSGRRYNLSICARNRGIPLLEEKVGISVEHSPEIESKLSEIRKIFPSSDSDCTGLMLAGNLYFTRSLYSNAFFEYFSCLRRFNSQTAEKLLYAAAEKLSLPVDPVALRYMPLPGE
ncbi:MAG: hypothetical protein PHW04_04885 [Candidatus Wallbacteria bacterium]|nr:hypothetical protein [Candidatus Wallbacteria bacterium]